MLEQNIAPVMKSLRFRQEREATWQQLEKLIDRLEKHGRQSLSTEDCLALPRLYRSTLSSLSVARAISLDTSITRYLEALCLRAYIHVYGSRTYIWDVLGRFFTQDWPQMVRKLWRPILMSALILITSWLLGAYAGGQQQRVVLYISGRGGGAGSHTNCQQGFSARQLVQQQYE
jgi:hypothetical protein